MNARNASALVEAGLWLQLSGDSQAARRLFEQAVRLEPANESAKKLLKLTPEGRTRPELALEMNPQFWPFLPLDIPPYADPFVRPDRVSSMSNQSSPLPESEVEADAGVGIGVEVQPPPQLNDIPVGPIQHEGLAREEPLDEPLTEDSPPPPPPQAELPPPFDREGELGRLIRNAKDLASAGDHGAALELIAQAETLAPIGDLTLRLLRENIEGALGLAYESRIGSLHMVPRVLITADRIVTLNLDQKSGFVLAQIDGSLTFEDLFALSGMSRFETARILSELLDEKVIAIDVSPPSA